MEAFRALLVKAKEVGLINLRTMQYYLLLQDGSSYVEKNSKVLSISIRIENKFDEESLSGGWLPQGEHF